MKICRAGFLILSLICALPCCARAQTGIYAMFSYSHITGQGVGYHVSASEHGSISPVGGTFGVYNDFLRMGPARLGGDARFFIQNSGGDKPYGSKATGALFGLRVDTAGIHLPLQPYGQIEVGAAGANDANSYQRTLGLAYEFQLGVDYTIIPRLDLRLEYGDGQITGESGPDRGLQQLGAGLVLRL